MKKIFFASIIMVLGFTSCIKEEPLYREADIETFTIEGEGLITSSISGTRVQLVVSDEEADYEALVPVIQLSPGATVVPASGEKQDFTNDVVYTVTSEDGNYTKKYTVNVTSTLNLKYDFEEWMTEGIGKMAYRKLEDLNWSSGNGGVSMAILLGKAKKFPTRDTTDAYSGESAALLETVEGGKNIPIAGDVPIFSGSLFRGEFEISILDDPITYAKFGILHPKSSGKPIKFTGYYKYLPGEVMIDKDGNEIPEKTDECSIYSVLYKITKGSEDTTDKNEEEEEKEREFLDGTNILTSDKVVARAVLKDTSKKEIYTRFDIPFIYSEELDYDKYDYKLAVVFASSKDGDKYEGAVGSRLTIDEVEVECEVIKD